MATQTKTAPKKATKNAIAAAPAKPAAKKTAPAKAATKAAPAKQPAAKAIPAAQPARPNMVNIYLHFNGNCEAAFTFYKKVLGGDFAVMMRFKDMPPGANTKPLSKADGRKVMHVSLPVSRETSLMGSDWPESMPGFSMGSNFAVSLSAGSKAEADRCFKELSAKGNVMMPMSNTFWGSYFGMFTDKFGISWMISFDQQPQQN